MPYKDFRIISQKTINLNELNNIYKILIIKKGNCNMKKYTQIISLFLSSALAFTCTGTTAGATVNLSTENGTDELHILSKVIDSNNNGLLRYSYVDENGNKYNLDTSSQDESHKTRKAANIPSRYDLREHTLTTSVKDQGVTGACWSFAAIKSIESSSIINNITEAASTDFSENHLAWFSYHGTTDTSNTIYGDSATIVKSSTPSIPIFGNIDSKDASSYDTGGNVLTAIATLAQWSGAEKEENAPFAANTYQEEYEMASFMKKLGETTRYNSLAHLQNAECYDNRPRQEIQQALMEHGAIDISMYYDKCGFENNSLGGKAFYQTRYAGKMAQKMANHCVTIVGWDDNYSRDNFAKRPSGDGAWLIANSYGTDYNDNGYFWLSYYEPSICDIFTLDVEPVSNYDNNYQYDGSGYADTIYIKNKKILGANIFTADKDHVQSLKAVSFYTITDGQPYTIKIYKNISGNSPEKGTLVKECTTSGTAKLSGYHTIPLSSECTINPGEKFSVIVTYKYNSSTGNQAYLPVEGKSSLYNGIRYSYSSKKGQSYYYLNKKWHDSYSSGYNNICIKAFTTDLDKENIPVPEEPATTDVPASVPTNTPTDAPTDTPTAVPTDTPTDAPVSTPEPPVEQVPSGSFVTTKVKLSKEAVILGKNEEYQLNASVSGSSSNTGSNNIKYTSSNNKVAVVESDGTVTAKSTGTAIITASADRAASATIKITVKKAPSKIKLANSPNKRLRQGGTFIISAKIPSGCASYHISYASSNKRIARVSQNGKVTAIRKGTATITVKTYNNKKASIKVTVK